MHVALLAILVFGFSHAPRFDDAAESIPVETITTAQLNQIMQGEKTAKPSPAKPAPAPPKAEPVPLPPTPPRPAPEPPTPPPPPPRPEPPKPEPPRPEPPKPEPPAPEPPAPEPPTRPEPPKPEPPKPQAEDAPRPPERRRPDKPVETPRPPERTRRTEQAAKPDKFRPDEIAKALARDKPQDRPQDKPRRSASAFDPNAIAKLIGQSKVAEAAPNAAPRQGLANRHSAQMSVSLENGLNAWFTDSYKKCWNLPPTNPAGETYVFNMRVTFNADGSLAARPVLLNPPHDPEWRAHADSVLRAVLRCNPLHIPAQYAPYFDQWRTKIVHFDPSSADG
jgi:hypothetical protein